MLKVFIGFDPRQPIAYNVLQFSIARRCSEPVAITPLILSQLPIKRRGLTEFTFSRFLVPWLCGYEGRALFLDADMLVKGDIAELFALGDDSQVQVMMDQARFERPSAMLFNNAKCKVLTPEFVDDTSQNPLELKWAHDVGKFPLEWNQIVGYGPTQPAKLYHYTRGIPVWTETQNNPEDVLWHRECKEMRSSCTYAALMGPSIHELSRKAC
jgi:hypothetical protein